MTGSANSNHDSLDRAGMRFFALSPGRFHLAKRRRLYVKVPGTHTGTAEFRQCETVDRHTLRQTASTGRDWVFLEI